MEFAVVGMLLALLVICRYYGIVLDRPAPSIILGLALYSSLAIVNNSFLFQLITPFFPQWSFVRRVSFELAMLVWLSPLLRPLPEPAPEPVLAASGLYPELAPALSGRMRELNGKLLNFFQR